MVFAVNIGYTFAIEYDYAVSVNSDPQSTGQVGTYLNDVVVNNSTKKIPIAYTSSTVQREINFDYSFSESTDFAVTYELSYEDGTSPSNVILNLIDRDNYIWDQETVLMDNSTTAYNTSSSSGTLYYLQSLNGTSFI